MFHIHLERIILTSFFQSISVKQLHARLIWMKILHCYQMYNIPLIVPVGFARYRNQNVFLSNMILIKYFLEEQNWLLFKCAKFLQTFICLISYIFLHASPMKISKQEPLLEGFVSKLNLTTRITKWGWFPSPQLHPS